MVIQYRIRLYLIFILLVGGFGVIISRLWEVQITKGEFYSSQVPGNTPVTISVPGVRGEIQDRNGVPLVTNTFEYNIVLNLKDIEKDFKKTWPKDKYPKVKYTVRDNGLERTLEETDIVQAVNKMVVEPLKELGLEITYSERELQAHYRENQGLVPYVFYHGLVYKQYAEFAEQDLKLNGVQLEAKPLRRYVYGALAAHTLGYEGAADLPREMEDLRNAAQGEGDEAILARNELERKYTYYVPNTRGIVGIEKAMNQYLTGRAGMREYIKNPKDQIVKQTSFTPPKPGYDVVLTLDLHAQYVTEKVMRHVGQGAAVVIDPKTGYILALTSVPSYNPNDYIPQIPQDIYDGYRNDTTKPLINRAVYPYAPGSVFKIPIALAGTKKGLQGKSQFCSGGWSPRAGKPIRCLGTHHTLGLRGAITKSCNAFFCQYGNETGIDTIEETTKLFGLGEKVGLPIFEPSGMLVPSPKRLQEQSGSDKWSPTRTALVSIGQGGVAVSPLQMASVAAALGNGGTVYKPQLIARIQDHEKSAVRIFDPIVQADLLKEGFKQEDIEKVRLGMKDVVNAPGGTARRAEINGVILAGKTGTAQYTNAKDDNHAWFICFAPYEDPKYAICVFVEHGASGGRVAAPLARKIMEELLKGPKSSPKNYDPLVVAKGSSERHAEIIFEEGSLLPVGEEDTADSAIELEDADTRAALDTHGELASEKPTTVREKSKLTIRKRGNRR